VVIFGEELHLKEAALQRTLDDSLPPAVDRTLALNVYEGSRTAEQGGPSIRTVLEDLVTLPFLAERRVVVIRDADSFISAHRERLEKYVASPSPTGVLVLECRSFPKTTRLYKAAVAAGAQLIECGKLSGRAVAEYVAAQVAAHGKRMDPDAAARLIELIGPDAGLLAGEVGKLCLYVGERRTVTADDVRDLVGQTREEKVFAAAESAALGRLADSLRLWRHVLETDPEARYRAIGGLAFVARRWFLAHRLLADGATPYEVAPKVGMWGRHQELETILRRVTPPRVRSLLAALAELDAQAKTGSRSIEQGVERLLVELAAGLPS